jgi:hypothetical protein
MYHGGFRNPIGIQHELDAIEIKSAMPNNSAYLHTLSGLGHENLDLNLGIHFQIRDGEKRHANVTDVDSQSLERAVLAENSDRSIEQLSLATTPVRTEIAFQKHGRKG